MGDVKQHTLSKTYSNFTSKVCELGPENGQFTKIAKRIGQVCVEFLFHANKKVLT